MQEQPHELIRRYGRLREILERAYTHRSWNSARIDTIANALCEIEKSLSRLGNLTGRAAVRWPRTR